MNFLLKSRSQKGAAVVEFALVAMLLFVIIVAMTEFSRAWVLLGVANGGDGAGARYAGIVADVEGSLDAVAAKVRDVLHASHIPDEDIHAQVAFGGSPSIGTPITISVIASFRTPFGNLFPRSKELPLKAACSMRREI
jgi:Flp pilus assembly pilin Flp